MRRVNLIATLGLVVASTSYAQSSVTLYGVIDEGVDWVSNVRTASGVG
ncbi:porin, partial [Burkholderia cenocepacia]